MITKVDADQYAPLNVAELPDYWDARRERDGKLDSSRCAAELRRALAVGRARRDGRQRLPSGLASRLAILESRYAGDVEANVAYARAKLGQLVRQGYSPIASHLLYTQPGVLDDGIPSERELGINAGLEWRNCVDPSTGEPVLTIFAVCRGWSNGMQAALALAEKEGRPT